MDGWRARREAEILRGKEGIERERESERGSERGSGGLDERERERERKREIERESESLTSRHHSGGYERERE